MKTHLLPVAFAAAALLGAAPALASSPAAPAAAPAPGAAADPAAVIARVSFVVGQAALVRPGEERQPIDRGLALREGDRLVTGDDGMVMMIFVDQGRIALRPGSELVIRRYRYDASGVADADLQLDLVRGTVRQISGAAAHRQPERYRLNTPVAAIGVRGTDFLARTDDEAVRTYVAEGAITVQPHDGSQEALLSRAGEGAALLELGDGRVRRESLQLADLEQNFRIDLAPAVSTADDASAGGRDVLVRQAPAVPPDHLPDSLASRRATEAVPLPAALVWSRSSIDRSVLPVSMLQPYEAASSGRHVTVGDPGSYSLWRSGAADATMASGLNGTVDFALAEGEAFVQAPGLAAQAARISQPQLRIDFDRARFETGLLLSAQSLPDQQLQVGGDLRRDGVFTGSAPDQRVAGALSLDGARAGYLFQVDADAGAWRGVTLWGRK